jgi:integrase
MPLSDTAIRTAKPGEKARKLSDGGGLYLEVSPSGGKWWRLKYRFEGKEKRLALGVYPDVGLKQARTRRDEARRLLADGIDPGAQRKAIKATRAEQAANTFELVAREWYATKSAKWAASHGERILRRMERDVFPWIGGQAIASITGPKLLPVLHRIAERGAVETAHRALQNCGQVFRYAVQTGRVERDVTADLRGALPSVTERKNFAAITEPRAVGGLLRALDGYEGSFIVKCALRLAPLVFVRPGELRAARWQDINLDAGEWRYLVSKTKTEHLVPLSAQALAILRELQPLTGGGVYVFPSARTPKRPMSDNAVLSALRRSGIPKEEMSGHGFRAMARTILHEVLGVDAAIIEHQLAHQVADALGTAYNRTKFLPQRRAMMQQWADYLDILKAGAQVIPIRQAA